MMIKQVQHITTLAFVFLLVCTATMHVFAEPPEATLEELKEGALIKGFRTEAMYLTDEDRPMGARFIHQTTGFTFDYLRIQSVPQGYIWVNSFPVSDMGEPHTQEHLLLGKGNKGRYVASLEDMAISGSNAFTQQWRTSYHFNTSAGADAFYMLTLERLDALLHPDYSDKEIRREVCNFGVVENPADGSFDMEEKGTVYNEMVSSFERPFSRLFLKLEKGMYGAHHPLSYSSGGLPAAIREMQPEDIRDFHRKNYILDNMGLIGTFPDDMPLDEVLEQFNEMLNALYTEHTEKPEIRSLAEVPTPEMAPEGTIFIAEYPNQNLQLPGPVIFAWPPTRVLDVQEELLIGLFIDNIAGDPTTNLYKRIVDTRTKTLDIGATGVFGWVDNSPGFPVMIGIGDVQPKHMTKQGLAAIRDEVIAEFSVIASWNDGSPEIIEFNQRLRNRITEMRRLMNKFISTPPGFGFRNTGSTWMDRLLQLERTGEYSRYPTLKPQVNAIETQVSGDKNIWKRYIQKWELATTTPYAAAALPSPEFVTREAKERRERIDAEVLRLKKVYNVSDAQQAIRRYQADYNATSRSLDSIAALVATPGFVKSPPLTLDDQLDYSVTNLKPNIPVVSATFDNMTGGTVGMVFDLRNIEPDLHLLLSLFPTLLTDVGVLENAVPVSHEEVSERIRTGMVGLSSYFTSNPISGRCELVLTGTGNTLQETQNALALATSMMKSPDWRPENLTRIRDLVDQTVSGLRTTMQGREEAWVQDPSAAFWQQNNQLFLTTRSFMTRTHNAHRLRWLLKDAGNEQAARAMQAFFDTLSSVAIGKNRARLNGLIDGLLGTEAHSSQAVNQAPSLSSVYTALPEDATGLANDALKDLKATLADIPDGSLTQDWMYLCAQMKNDLATPSNVVLGKLNSLRSQIFTTGNARMFVVGSSTTLRQLQSDVAVLVRTLPESSRTRETRNYPPLVTQRLSSRLPANVAPIFVGLVNPNTSSGVFLHSASSVGYHDTDRESLLQMLSSMLYSGGGAHGIFMKTWGAGLAYSNGIRLSLTSGRINYYAERCPTLPQTLQFVINELRNAQYDSTLVDYTIAQAFGGMRSASTYESRTESMAADLADGLTPEVIANFRKALLKLRSEPNLAHELFNRMEAIYGKVLPGYGPRSASVDGGVFMVIGPEAQMKEYENYLKTAESPETPLYRIYPRDFWMPSDVIHLLKNFEHQ